MIHPLEAWVYRNEPKVAPVRDALSPKQAQKLLSDPYQSLHIAFPSDPEQLYTTWNRWIRERVLRREPLPTLYAYSQTFYRYGEEGRSYQRIGIIGLLPVEAPILPHEAILPDRLSGLLQGLARLPVQATPIHVLATGDWEKIIALSRSYLVCPQFVYGGDDGVMHRWVPIHHWAHQRLIQKALDQATFYIADGHHRWHAIRALGLRYLLVYVTPIQDDTLIIVPTHRFVRSPESLQNLLERFFVLRPSAARIPLWQEIRGLRHALGVVAPGGRAYTARLKPEYWAHLEERPLVALLHEWILDQIGGDILTSREPAALIQAASRGEGWTFILPELPLTYVKRAAQVGQTLPPKATFFFPKVLSGLCFYHEGDTRFSISEAAGSS
ncbi:MAG: DUF1015 domain-containing protein [Bacteroidia bacterium]|nr:DUF1015 domain-containing protein [Bacteroidia bacterium]